MRPSVPELNLQRYVNMCPTRLSTEMLPEANYFSGRINHIIYTTGAFIMAKNAYRSWNNEDQLRFLDLVITEEDLAEYEAWKETGFEQGLDCVFQMVAEGWKVTVKPDVQNKRFTAQAQFVLDNHPDRNAFFSAFAPTVADALLLLLFKHEFMLKGKSLPFQSANRTMG
jgi:hypothetical protein